MSEMEKSADSLDGAPSASRLLREARESLELSAKDVADQLFLSVSHIEFIEKEEFDRFPKKMFIKGYLRSYARIVGLDGDELVQIYEASIQPEEVEEEESPEKGKAIELQSQKTAMRIGFAGLGILLLVMLLLWLLFDDTSEQVTDSVDDNAFQPGLVDIDTIDRVPGAEVSSLSEEEVVATEPDVDKAMDDNPDALVETQVTEEATEAAEETEEEAEEVQVASLTTDTETGFSDADIFDPGAEVDEPVEPVSDAQRMASLKEFALERVKDRDEEYVILRAGGEDELELRFTDDCWVEVTDGDDELIYKELNRTGDVLKIVGKAPYELLFGKADSVSLHYRGEPVDFDNRIRSDLTARVRVGE